MNLLNKIRTFSFHTTALRTFGLLFLVSGLMGNLMQQLSGASAMTGDQLLEYISTDSSSAATVAFSLVLYCLEACAVPLYTFLLVEGVTHTSSFIRYMGRVTALALLCQLPFNLAMTGNLLTFVGLNPAFAMVLSMAMLYFFRRFPDKKPGSLAIKALAIIGAFLWSNMLGIPHGAVCVLLTAVLWALRGKQNLQTWAGMIVMLASCVFSLYYLVAPISFLILHFYEGEQGPSSRIVNYAAYPAVLLVFGLAAVIL